MKRFCLVRLCLLFCTLAAYSPYFKQNAIAVDNIVITGKVGAAASDMSVQLVPSTNSILPQEKTVKYTLTYGSKLLSATPLTLQTSWDKGTIDGATDASAEIVEYVIGSAESSGTAQPTIDLLKKTITWTIPSFPANTLGKSVSFELRTVTSYTGSKKVFFPVSARILSPAVTPDVTIYHTYQYEPPVITATPTPKVTPTPSTTAAANLEITSVQFRQIHATTTTLQVTTNIDASLRLQYGTNKQNLKDALTTLSPTQLHTFELDTLLPSTRYYIRISPANGDTHLTTSDMYVFDTATNSVGAAEADENTLVVAQQGNIVYDAKINTKGQERPPIVAILGNTIDLNITIPKSEHVKHVEILVRDAKVLGASTESSDELQTSEGTMTEVAPLLFVGKVKIPEIPGLYEVVTRIEDIFGNISEQKVAEMKVVKPFVVLSKKDKKPIEMARVLLSRYNEKTTLFEVIPNSTTSVHNPVYSNDKGIVSLNLYAGKYQANISAPGYGNEVVPFEIDPSGNADLPHVELTPVRLNVFEKIQQNFLVLQDISTSFVQEVQNLARSSRFFDFMFTITLVLLGLLSLVSLRIRLTSRRKKVPPQLVIDDNRLFMNSAYTIISMSVRHITSFLCESFLVLSLMFEFLFLKTFGVFKTIPFFLFTCVCIALLVFDSYTTIKTLQKQSS